MNLSPIKRLLALLMCICLILCSITSALPMSAFAEELTATASLIDVAEEAAVEVEVDDEAENTDPYDISAVPEQNVEAVDEGEASEPKKKTVFNCPDSDEDFPDDYESDDYNRKFAGIAPLTSYEGTVSWPAITYTDKTLSFDLSSTTVSGATFKGFSSEKTAVGEVGSAYGGNKYRTFDNTSFDDDHTITLPDAGFYIKDGKLNRVKVVLQVKVLKDSQGNHGTGAFVTTGHPGHFGIADLLEGVGRGSRTYTYIAVKPLFYYAGTNTRITDYTLIVYVTDIDPATTKSGKNPGIEAWAISAASDKTVSLSTPSSVKSIATLTQTVDGVVGGSSIESPTKRGNAGTNWYYLPAGSDTGTTDTIGVDAVRFSIKKQSGDAAPEFWYSADIAHFSRIRGFNNKITYTVLNSATEMNTLTALNGNNSVTPDTFSVVTYTATNGDAAKAAINDHANLASKGWKFSGWYTSQSAVPATWAEAKANYNASTDNATVYGGVARMANDVKLYGRYYPPSNEDWEENIVSVKKISTETGEALSGAVFALQQWNGTNYADYSPAVKLDEVKQGEYVSKLKWTNTNQGKFRVVETKAPDGCVNTGWSKEFEWVNEDDEFSFTCSDPMPKGVLNLTKTDAKTGSPMKGVKFTLFAEEDIVSKWGTKLVSAGVQVAELTTDAAGKASAAGLYVGKYILREVTPSGYMATSDRHIVISYPANETTSTVNVNVSIQNTPIEDTPVFTPSPRLAVAKLANKTTGATLNTSTGRYSGTKKAGTYSSGETITFTLTGTNTGNVDLYDVTLTEDTSNYAAYLVKNSFAYGLTVGNTVQTKKGKTATVTAVTNSGNLYSVKLDKLATGDSITLTASGSLVNNGNDVENLVNTVTISGKYDTSDNGIDGDNLRSLTETSEMEDSDRFNLIGDKPAETPKAPSLAVAKLANKTTGATLNTSTGRYSGTKKAGTYSSGETITFTLTATNTGNVDLYDVEFTEDISDYAYLHPSKADEYFFTLVNGKTITTAKGKTATVKSRWRSIQPTENYYGIVFDKLEKGDSITLTVSCSFSFANINAENLVNTVTISGKYDTSDNGIDGDNLRSLTETSEMEDSDRFNLGANTGSITLFKRNSSNQPLKGVTFALKDSKGTVVAEKTTDSSGKVVFDKLLLGEYTVTETKTVDGYSLLPSAIHATVPLKFSSASEAAAAGYDVANATLVNGEYCFFDVAYTITNTPVLSMPATGVQSNQAWLIFAGFMMLAAGYYIFLSHKRQ